MQFYKTLIAGKLRRWEKYMENYRLPAWNEIPNIGLYMEQVISFMSDCLDYLSPELKEEQLITAATINNYVRKKIMPKPRGKKYYRIHLVYLLIICTLKSSLSISTIQKIIPADLSEQAVKVKYTAYVERHKLASQFFAGQMRSASAGILNQEAVTEITTDRTEDLITTATVVSGFAKLLAEKLILLDGRDVTNGGSIEIAEPSDS